MSDFMTRDGIKAYSDALRHRCGDAANPSFVIAQHFDIMEVAKADVVAAFNDIERALAEAHRQMDRLHGVYTFPVTDLQRRVLLAAREIMLSQLGLTDAHWTDKP